ncbi:MAG TPA: T9SS type A sorting domain-containing protein [Bacteroidetes bacterium]|nr:T9SS type A sorting domain-containing protein [Bacteroidota bacterium]
MSLKRYLTALCTILLTFSTAIAVQDQNTQGTTTTLQQEYKCIAEDLAKVRTSDIPSSENPLSDQLKRRIWGTTGTDEWLPLDSCITLANIPAGDRYVIRLNIPNNSIDEILPANDLNDLCMRAVARAPRWVRGDLINNLNAIGGEWAESSQEFAAEIILNAEDPYIDEIAFTIAHLSPSLFEDMNVSEDLIIENAEGIYEADEYLDYVTIIDNGDADDDNYWTTLEYNIKTEDEDTVQVEIDPEIYYWYVVHPRLSDEVPQYIDPATGRSAQPPRGVFWRDFLLNHPDDDYPSLREVLEDCGVMWSNLFNDGSPDNGAVGIITQWMQTSMEFTSRQERPVQPVRIYRLHIGRCGEWSDLTAAASRAALIPAICNMTFCNDHTWNEFWDGHWISWEPVNTFVGDSLAYENRWDWVFPAVWDWRSDGYVWTVTERYSEGVADLNVSITSRGHPVDGAEVMLASENDHGGLSPATWGYTNSEGQVSFKVGDDRTIYLRVESEVGNFPAQANTVTRIISNSRADAVYDWDHDFDRTIDHVSPDDADEPDDPLNHYHLSIGYELLSETVNGQIFNNSEFFAEIGEGRLNFFICDEENYELYEDEEDFVVFNSEELTGSGEIDFTFPTDGEWYVVFSNENRLANIMLSEVETRFYVDSEFGVKDDIGQGPADYMLYQNYPNPFNSHTNIAFDNKKAGVVKVTLYDISGRKIFGLPLGTIPAGHYSVPVNAGNLKSGVYLYELDCNDFRARKTMILLR